MGSGIGKPFGALGAGFRNGHSCHTQLFSFLPSLSSPVLLFLALCSGCIPDWLGPSLQWELLGRRLGCRRNKSRDLASLPCSLLLCVFSTGVPPLLLLLSVGLPLGIQVLPSDLKAVFCRAWVPRASVAYQSLTPWTWFCFLPEPGWYSCSLDVWPWLFWVSPTSFVKLRSNLLWPFVAWVSALYLFHYLKCQKKEHFFHSDVWARDGACSRDWPVKA